MPEARSDALNLKDLTSTIGEIDEILTEIRDHRQFHVYEEFVKDLGDPKCQLCRELRNGQANSVSLPAGKQKVTISITNDMAKALEKERKARMLESLQEAIKAVLGEYFKLMSPNNKFNKPND